MKRCFSVLLVVGLLVMVQGCGSRAWYDGFKEQQRQDCLRHESRSEVQECLEGSQGLTHDQYREEVKGSRQAE